MVLNVINWNVNPVALSLGPLQIRWYGILWALGFLLGYLMMKRVYKREKMPDNSLDNLLIYMLASTIIGARLGHCLFYEPEYYLAHPLKMLAIWEGGLASHGGAIGILIGLWIYARRVKKPYIWILDRIVMPISPVGALIRIGNLMNSEIYGMPTSLPWGFRFLRGQEQFCGTFDNYTACCPLNGCCPPTEWLPCHPTGIYEALFCLLVLVVLLWLYYKKDMGDKQPGLMLGLFMIVVFGSRIAIEFLKNVQVDFERNMFLDMGQWLSVPFVITGIAIWIWSARKRKKHESFMSK